MIANGVLSSALAPQPYDVLTTFRTQTPANPCERSRTPVNQIPQQGAKSIMSPVATIELYSDIH